MQDQQRTTFNEIKDYFSPSEKSTISLEELTKTLEHVVLNMMESNPNLLAQI